MDAMERDPVFIAEQVKSIRKVHRLTQENLAAAAGLSTRTIEKIESGRHRPDEQTLRSIARAVQIDRGFFVKPTPEQEARQAADFDRALRKTVLASITQVRTAGDFLASMGHREAFRVDISAVRDDEALAIAALMADWINECGDVWAECSMSQRLDYGREFIEYCRDIEKLGYLCFMGSHKQQLRDNDRPRLVFSVAVMVILPKGDAPEKRYAMIQLEGGWETLEEDRSAVI